MSVRLPTIFIVSAMIVGCSLGASRTVRLWTDNSDLVTYIDLFNTQTDRYRVEMIYLPDLDRALRVREDRPDIVFAKYLANRQDIQYLRPLNRFMRRTIDRQAIYSRLLELGRYNQRQRLLPVSFNLPMVIFRSAEHDADTDLFGISLDEIRDRSAQFNRLSGERLSRLGFSPRWNSDILYIGAILYGASFGEDRSGNPTWDQTALEEALEYFAAWIEEQNGGIDREDAFNRRYFYGPTHHLLEDARIRYHYSHLQDYLLLSDSVHRELNFLWIRSEIGIPVLDSILFAGIGADAAHPRGAIAFLSWFFNAENQRNLLEAGREKGLHSFGIAGGFSSLIEVNERVFPQIYPDLLGRIPPDELLWFPQRTPRNWGSIREEVIAPWLLARLNGTDVSPLSKGIETWRLRFE